MTPTTVVALGRDAIEMVLMISAPPLIASLVVGLVLSIFQAATQINEMTLTFVPKVMVMFLTLLIAGPWMLTTMTDYIHRLYAAIPGLIG
ncbi:flagellar biosynthesis protein FliQ [Niveibacterium umoris]|uniref:Flagellar biosynthetic protein FliQ n=1 Tax=Niveibacterium umoris TaxID=1193620 RepID=A0A840BHS3_9RHOO|nr:flagellar biosynthesis protein FliQ [Niveibacterium umoris]MBB4011142.1 flagellar biosynthetic protein FliQ [Niveibacterium umoris]